MRACVEKLDVLGWTKSSSLDLGEVPTFYTRRVNNEGKASRVDSCGFVANVLSRVPCVAAP